MTNRGLLRTTLLLLAIPSGSAAMEFGPGEAAGRFPARLEPEPLTSKSLFGIAGTMRWGPSSIRSTTCAKESIPRRSTAWIKDIPAKYPAYIVLVRDVDLKREKGETEKLKVGSVIKRELVIAAALSGIIVGEGLRTSPGSPYLGPSQAPSVRSFAQSSPG